MSPLSPVSLLARLAVCVAVTWAGMVMAGWLTGIALIGLPLTAPVWGAMFARPMVEVFPGLARLAHGQVFGPWEGKYYRYNRTHLRVHADGDRVWFVAADVLAVLDKKVEPWLDTRFTPEEYGTIPGRREKGFSPAGVVKLTRISEHPEAAKFRLWFERAVVFTLHRKKDMRDTRVDA